MNHSWIFTWVWKYSALWRGIQFVVQLSCSLTMVNISWSNTMSWMMVKAISFSSFSVDSCINRSSVTDLKSVNFLQMFWLKMKHRLRWATTTGQPPTLTILYMYCTGGTECLSRRPTSHSPSMYVVRVQLSLQQTCNSNSPVELYWQ